MFYFSHEGLRCKIGLDLCCKEGGGGWVAVEASGQRPELLDQGGHVAAAVECA